MKTKHWKSKEADENCYFIILVLYAVLPLITIWIKLFTKSMFLYLTIEIILLGELSRKQKENIELTAQIHQLKTELDDVKSQLVVAGLTLESNFEVEKRKAEEEIASLQQLVHGISCFFSNCKNISK